MKTVPDNLREAAATYEERNKKYGDNYKKFGYVWWPIMHNMQLTSPADVNRMGILVQIFSKLTRYCEQFNNGGHDDTILDLCVYAAMLRELDEEMRQLRAFVEEGK